MAKYYLVLFLILHLTLVLCGRDYYKLLGVKRNADENQIKRAFRKMSVKYHPDKNRDNPDATKKFQEIAEAYEVLSDPKKKEIYDMYGEEGIKQDSQREAQQGGGGHPGFQGMDIDEIFKHFSAGGFGGGFGGGSQQFHFNMGGGGMGGGFGGQQRQQVEDPFKEVDVVRINIETLSEFYRRKIPWVMFFYKPTSSKTKLIAEELKILSERMYDIIGVGVVDCVEEVEVCEELGVYKTPTIKIYSEKFTDEGEKYKGKFEWKPISSAATAKMQSFVSLVTDNNYFDFIGRDKDYMKVILFTNKKGTPPMYKALSKFGKKFKYGIVRDDQELVKHFKISSLPSVCVITDAMNYEAD